MHNTNFIAKSKSFNEQIKYKLVDVNILLHQEPEHTGHLRGVYLQTLK